MQSPDFLRGDCPYDPCTHDHYYKPNKNELATLKYVSRMTPCKFGSECDDVKCIYGHRCPNDVEGISLISIVVLGLPLSIIEIRALICGHECRKEGLSLGRELPLREGVARARQGRCQDSESRQVDQGCDRRGVGNEHMCSLVTYRLPVTGFSSSTVFLNCQ